jgi:hypothetical protein
VELKILSLPHTSRQLKAFAGYGFDANVCADVYNLYVIKKYISQKVHLPRWQLIYRLVDSGSFNSYTPIVIE